MFKIMTLIHIHLDNTSDITALLNQIYIYIQTVHILKFTDWFNNILINVLDLKLNLIYLIKYKKQFD